MIRREILLGVALAALIGLACCPAQAMVDEGAANVTEDGDIPAVMAANGNLTTLGAAVEAANLTGALGEEGPFTVFAPNDEVFAALPPGILDILLEDTDALTRVLTYHVAEGAYMAADLGGVSTLPSLQGGNLTINATESGVLVDNASVIEADVTASNGVIHVIDAVLVPAPTVLVADQEIVNESVTVLLVANDEAGWMVIHADDNGAPGPILGSGPVAAGANINVTVEIAAENATDTMYAMLHTDAGTPGEFEFPGPDGPVMADGVVVAPPFNATMAM